MAVDPKIERILRLYPDACQPQSIEPVASAEGFSGAKLWRLSSARGPLCLRRWPTEHPSQQRLEFIQAVLWHVDQEGFHLVPLPLETRHHHGYVWHEGHLWELTPWLPGTPNYRSQPNPAKLESAMRALAGFHEAAVSFPLPEPGPTYSPGLLERRDRLAQLMAGGAAALRESLGGDHWPELELRAKQLVSLFFAVAPRVQPLVERAGILRVPLQPCIRDIWHPHVLFVDDVVKGIVDFGALRPENVACDVARLLGSLARDQQADWQRGLAAYQRVRPLSDEELILVSAFDRSTVLMGGLQWLQWIYLDRREFADRAAVLERIDEFLARLATLWNAPD